LTALGDPDPARIQLRGLYWPLLTTGAICVLCVFASPLLGELRNRCGAQMLIGLEGSWHAAQALSVAAAIRAIREPRALWLSAVAALAVFGAALLMRVHG